MEAGTKERLLLEPIRISDIFDQSSFLYSGHSVTITAASAFSNALYTSLT